MVDISWMMNGWTMVHQSGRLRIPWSNKMEMPQLRKLELEISQPPDQNKTPRGSRTFQIMVYDESHMRQLGLYPGGWQPCGMTTVTQFMVDYWQVANPIAQKPRVAQ